MPTVCVFNGIVPRMYVNDHNPPHFHAEHGGDEAFISIATGEMIEGRLARAAAHLVRKWALARQRELLDNWARGRAGKLPQRILEPDAD